MHRTLVGIFRYKERSLLFHPTISRWYEVVKASKFTAHVQRELCPAFNGECSVLYIFIKTLLFIVYLIKNFYKLY